MDEVRQLLNAAGERRSSARWAIALALGLRQGEVLGLSWSDVDLDAGRCGSARAAPSPLCPRLRRHLRQGPGYCPRRILARTETDDTKSRAGRRAVGLPVSWWRYSSSIAWSRSERATAAQLWRDSDWVFTSPVGAPVNPNSDYHHWKGLLTDAGVRDGRLHDARHTAATVLLVLGVPERAVMGIMGWSRTAMAARYQHVTDPIRRQVADQVGGLLWSDERAVE